MDRSITSTIPSFSLSHPFSLNQVTMRCAASGSLGALRMSHIPQFSPQTAIISSSFIVAESGSIFKNLFRIGIQTFEGWILQGLQTVSLGMRMSEIDNSIEVLHV